MNLWLLIGYAANVVFLTTSILVARTGMPGLEPNTAFAVSQGLLVLLLPAGIITLRGAIRSQGKLRRVLGYSVFGLDLVLCANGLLVAALVLFSGAKMLPN